MSRPIPVVKHWTLTDLACAKSQDALEVMLPTTEYKLSNLDTAMHWRPSSLITGSKSLLGTQQMAPHGPFYLGDQALHKWDPMIWDYSILQTL